MATNNRPVNLLDAQSRTIYDSVDYTEFRGQYTGTNLIYAGFARPGANEGDLVWQISFLTYDGSNNLLSVKWPQLPSTNASNDFLFSWTLRATYTYV
jgi:hypothetical protein